MISLRALESYARPRHSTPEETCGLCAAPAGEGHRHIVDVERKALLCACPACAFLFVTSGPSKARFRTVPSRVVCDESFQVTEASWSSLEIPVRLAFLFFSSSASRWIALYPSPAGVTESALALDAWDAFARAPLVQAVEPDVEALLVYGRRGAAHFETYLVPIDVCYELAGILRRRWRGLGGGDEVWREIEDAFVRLRDRSQPLVRSQEKRASS
jgi:hypothetical protein